MKKTIVILFFFSFVTCRAQDKIKNYANAHSNNDKPSISGGTVSAGTLSNGKLMPFVGKNFHYFDTTSYLEGRAFLNQQLLQTLLSTYKELETLQPNRQFVVMECSNEKGGKIFPHRTHQNGLSVDLMVPLIKDKKAYYALDTLGATHYWLDFDNSGKYTKDATISIDFNLIAQHILLLDQHARKNGLKISKVILNTDLKDELFATPYGKKLSASGIYIVKSLTPMINALHDDHYHIDFEFIK